MSVEILHQFREKVIDQITTSENELTYGVWTTSYHSFLLFTSREVVKDQIDKIDLLHFASDYVPYALYPYLGVRIALGAGLIAHSAYRLRDNHTYYKVAAKMIVEDITKIPQKY